MPIVAALILGIACQLGPRADGSRDRHLLNSSALQVPHRASPAFRAHPGPYPGVPSRREDRSESAFDEEESSDLDALQFAALPLAPDLHVLPRAISTGAPPRNPHTTLQQRPYTPRC